MLLDIIPWAWIGASNFLVHFYQYVIGFVSFSLITTNKKKGSSHYLQQLFSIYLFFYYNVWVFRMYVWICTTWSLQWSVNGVTSPGTGVNLVSAGNQTWIICPRSKCLQPLRHQSGHTTKHLYSSTSLVGKPNN